MEPEKINFLTNNSVSQENIENLYIEQGTVKPKVNNTIRNTIKLFDLKKEYMNKFTEEKVIFIDIKNESKRIIELLEKDVKTIQDIESYNSKHFTNYNFATYRAMFPYYLPQEILTRCIPYPFTIPEKSNMKFTFFKENRPTFDEYIKMKNKSLYASREEVEKFIEDFEGKYLSDDSEEVPKELMDAFMNIQKNKQNGGRPKNYKPIYKYDLNGNLVDTYKGRQECMEKDGLTKAGLSQHLKGKRYSLKGFIYKEK